VTGLVEGWAGLRALGSRLVRWRVGLGWWLVAIGSPVVLFVLAAVVARALGEPWPDLRRLGEVNFLPTWAGALLLWTLTSGLGEEVGWRGYALPRLQRGRRALAASLILGGLWALWHLPAFFYLPTYQQLGLAIFPGFALGVVLAAIWTTWLYNSSRGSLLLLVLWHGVYNFVTAAKISDGTIATVISIAIMVWAVLLVLVFRPATLSHTGKVEA
jgi:membrane protease YdiL (CAAX protease family)